MADDGWARVGRAIDERIRELGLTKAEVIRRSGVSDVSLNGYIDGQPIKRADKRKGLCAALGWAPESIDAVRAGGEPVVSSADPGLVEEVRLLRQDVARLTSLVERMGTPTDAPQPHGSDA